MNNDFHIKYAHLLDEGKLKSVSERIPDNQTIQNVTQLFTALGDVTRLKIVISLQNAELCVHEIAALVKLSVSAVSHQLRLLKTMNLVKYRKQGKMVYYLLDDEHISNLLMIAKEHIEE